MGNISDINILTKFKAKYLIDKSTSISNTREANFTTATPVVSPDIDISNFCSYFSYDSTTSSYKSNTTEHSSSLNGYVKIKLNPSSKSNRLSVKCKASSELNYDIFYISVLNSSSNTNYINVYKFKDSGNKDWTTLNYTIQPTDIDANQCVYVHFTYKKDSSVSSFSDACYIDNITLYEQVSIADDSNPTRLENIDFKILEDGLIKNLSYYRVSMPDKAYNQYIYDVPASTTITLTGLSKYNGSTVNWGDGTVDTNKTHTYAQAGKYFIQTMYKPITSEKYIIDCLNISSYYTSCNQMFTGCINLNPANEIVIPSSVTDCAYMFKNCTYFNQPVVIPNNVTNCFEMFYGCSSLNKLITIGSSVSTCQSMFYNCTAFNQPITISSSVTDYREMFYNCTSFNQPITMSNNSSSNSTCYRMFRNCTSFNQPVVISSSTTNCSGMFYNCTSFNQEVIIPDKATNCSEMFNSCKNFNQPVVIPNNVTNCNSMFLGCGLRQLVTIGNKVTECSNMFTLCQSFNQPVVIPNSVTVCNGMFSACTSFNQPVVIPSGVTDCAFVFSQCSSFNQSVDIPDGVTKSEYMFQDCTSFNQPISIPNTVTNCNNMFKNCTSFNQPISIPNIATDCNNMFKNCTSLNQVIDVPNTVKDLSWIFDGCSSLTIIGPNLYNIMLEERRDISLFLAFRGCYAIVSPIPYSEIPVSYK